MNSDGAQLWLGVFLYGIDGMVMVYYFESKDWVSSAHILYI